jgi:hypothetical protein
VIGVVSKGHILGLDEASFGLSNIYNTGAVCLSLEAELFKIEKDFFMKLM